MNQDLTDEEMVSSYYANSSSFADCMYYDDFYYAIKESPFYNELRAYMGVPFVEWLKFSAELNSIATADDSPSTSEILMQYQTLAVQANGDYGQFAEQFDEILSKYPSEKLRNIMDHFTNLVVDFIYTREYAENYHDYSAITSAKIREINKNKIEDRIPQALKVKR